MIAASCDRERFVGGDQVHRGRNYLPGMDWIEFQRVRRSIRVKPNGRCERFLEQVERRRPVCLDLPSISVAPRSFSSTTPERRRRSPVRSSKHVPLNISIGFFRAMRHRMSVFRRVYTTPYSLIDWSRSYPRTRDFPRDCRRSLHPRIFRAVSGSFLHENLIECYTFFCIMPRFSIRRKMNESLEIFKRKRRRVSTFLLIRVSDPWDLSSRDWKKNSKNSSTILQCAGFLRFVELR